MINAINTDNYERVEQAINDGGKLDAWDHNGDTPLLLAISINPKIVELLLKKGAIPDAVSKENMTPLMVASEYGQIEIMLNLIGFNANIEAVTDDNVTSLMLAASNGQVNAARTLIEAGADIQAVDTAGNTAKALAHVDGHQAVVALISAHEEHQKVIRDVLAEISPNVIKPVIIKNRI